MSRESLVIIKWRDIPAQVLAKRGRDTHRSELPPRFSAAIDRAAMRAGKTTADDYLEDWRRESQPVEGDLADAVSTAVERIDSEYPTDVLNALVANLGYEGTT